jgi:hypothetical protein
VSFLSPAFLLGTLAIGLPVIFHLIRRTTRYRKIFSSIMFLVPSPPRLSRRSRLEHLFLLLLRSLAIVLLATGFARPFLKDAPPLPPGGPARSTLVLVDVSASMRRQGLWDNARRRAVAIASEASPVDQVALFTFDRVLKPLLPFDQWRSTPEPSRLALAREKLETLQPGWAATALDTALIQAVDILAQSEQGSSAQVKRVVILTDLQEGSQTQALQGHDWPRDVEIRVERLLPTTTGNAGIHLVADSADAGLLSEAAVRVRVTNASDSKQEQLHAGWADADGNILSKTSDIYVPPGQTRVLPLSAPPTNTPVARAVLRGDQEPFDNTVYVIPPERSPVTVLYLGNDSASDSRQPLFFLQRAFQQTRVLAIRVVAAQPSAPLAGAAISQARLLVVTDVSNDASATVLAEAVTRGQTLVLAPKDAATLNGCGRRLGLGKLQAQDSRLDGYALLGEIDFRHPLFAPFADARYSDFTKIHFWKYRKFDASTLAGAQVLARFDNGDPAIVQIPRDKGRIILLASGWRPADGQLALSSKFVPLLYSLLDLAGTTPMPRQQYFVGDSVALPAPASQAAERTMLLPDGTRVPLGAGQTEFTGTSLPGVYSVIANVTTNHFAVNLDPAESRTAPLPSDELERLGVPAPRPGLVATSALAKATHLQDVESEGRQKLWRWFILAALAVLGLETWIAGRTARSSAVQQEVIS